MSFCVLLSVAALLLLMPGRMSWGSAGNPVSGDGYSFQLSQRNGKDPITWDRCDKIHVVVNRSEMPAGVMVSLRAALDTVSKASGLSFAIDGFTDEQPDVGRPLVDEDRYGEQRAPVLIAWSSPKGYGGLEGDVLARTVVYPTFVSGFVDLGSWDKEYISGQVVLDAPQIAASDDPDTLTHTVLLHELAHLVGLGHTDDPSELMYRTTTSAVAFGPGDLRGLALAGGVTYKPKNRCTGR